MIVSVHVQNRMLHGLLYPLPPTDICTIDINKRPKWCSKVTPCGKKRGSNSATLGYHITHKKDNIVIKFRSKKVFLPSAPFFSKYDVTKGP